MNIDVTVATLYIAYEGFALELEAELSPLEEGLLIGDNRG